MSVAVIHYLDIGLSGHRLAYLKHLAAASSKRGIRLCTYLPENEAVPFESDLNHLIQTCNFEFRPLRLSAQMPILA